MVEMPMMPSQPAADPIGTEATIASDAPQGAFEEMLARRLGRQLVGRFAEDDDARDQGAGGDGDPTPWLPAPGSVPDPLGSNPAGATGTSPQREGPIGAIATPTPVKVHVNRPGFPSPMAEPGLIQPGPSGEVWTHPSGFADLQLTRGATAARPSPATSDLGAAPEPPTVHWTPAPARAAMAASANRDLELEIVTQMRTSMTPDATKPDLRVVEAPAPGDVRSLAQAPHLTDIPDGVPTVGTAPTPSGDALVGGSGTTPAPHHAALVDRVLNAVEMQQHLPPPRAISVEIPEMEGLRLLVTMRMDGTLQVTSSTPGNAPPPNSAAPLLQAVNDALTERGFDMSADTGGRQNDRGAEEEPAPTRPTRFRRSARRSGLRI